MMNQEVEAHHSQRLIRVTIGPITLEGDLHVPAGARGLVLFAHGSGSSRHSPRNRFVAGVLQDGRLATLLIDLLTQDEERIDARTAHLRFDIGLLADRLTGAAAWLKQQPDTHDLQIGCFGASTGGGATHLFEEPGTLEQVARLARDWFSHYLALGSRQRAVGQP